MDLNTQLIDRVSRLLLEKTGQALNSDRHFRIESAVETVLRNRGISRVSDLAALLTLPESASIEQELLEGVLNNETYFFRDRQVFNFLANRVLPDLALKNEGSRKLSIWSAACSTGQEPLSLAMLFLQKPELWSNWHIEIRATDVSEAALRVARNATYANFEVQRGLGVSEMLKFFEETPYGWRAKDQLLRMIHFEKENLLTPPACRGMFDLILCRNVILYLHPAARRTVCKNIAAALKPDGKLLVGGGEVIAEHTDDMRPIAGEFGLYQLASAADKAAGGTREAIA